MDTVSISPSAQLQRTAADLLTQASGSLYYAALYAAAAHHPDACAALECAEEQIKLMHRLLSGGLTPFGESDDHEQVRAWLDAHSERKDHAHPMLARYAELHALRWRWLPPKH